MNFRASTLTGRLAGSLSSWVRGRRGSVSVEFVFGSFLIITVTVGGLDLYRVVEAQSLVLHAATTMADYVSLEVAPSEAFIKDLAVFSHRNEIALPSLAAFVVSAVSRSEATAVEPDPPVVVRWDRKIVVGEEPGAPPSTLGETCGRLLGGLSDAGGAMQALGMEPGEMVIVVEVCVKLPPQAFMSDRLLAGSVFPTLFYQHQILPVRGDRVPVEPS